MGTLTKRPPPSSLARFGLGEEQGKVAEGVGTLTQVILPIPSPSGGTAGGGMGVAWSVLSPPGVNARLSVSLSS